MVERGRPAPSKGRFAAASGRRLRENYSQMSGLGPARGCQTKEVLLASHRDPSALTIAAKSPFAVSEEGLGRDYVGG